LRKTIDVPKDKTYAVLLMGRIAIVALSADFSPVAPEARAKAEETYNAQVDKLKAVDVLRWEEERRNEQRRSEASETDRISDQAARRRAEADQWWQLNQLQWQLNRLDPRR
jgi:hypothetical protein